MTVEIDLTDLDPHQQGQLPEPTIIFDCGDIITQFGETSLKMTTAQFHGWLECANRWWNTVGAGDGVDVVADIAEQDRLTEERTKEERRNKQTRRRIYGRNTD